MLTDQPYRYLTVDDMKSLGDDSLPIDVTRDERVESVIGTKNVMDVSQGIYCIEQHERHLIVTDLSKSIYLFRFYYKRPTICYR